MSDNYKSFTDSMYLLESNPMEYDQYLQNDNNHSEIYANIKNPSLYDFYGGNPLHCLMLCYGNIKPEYIIYGDNTNFSDNVGISIFNNLISLGCDPYACDYYGDTPYLILNRIHHTENLGYSEFYNRVNHFYRDYPITIENIKYNDSTREFFKKNYHTFIKENYLSIRDDSVLLCSVRFIDYVIKKKIVQYNYQCCISPVVASKFTLEEYMLYKQDYFCANNR